MASSPKQANGNISSNSTLGKRKKSRSKGTYLSKWLDKTLHHIQEATPSMDTYDPYVHINWPNASQFAPGYDPFRMNMCEPTSLPSMPTYYNPMMPYYGPDCRYVQGVNQSVQVQRPRRRRHERKAEEVHSSNPTPNGILSNYFQPKNFSDSQDFASLPPIVTSVGDTNSNSENKDGNGNSRRNSDPCMQELPDVTRPVNGDAESSSESESDMSGSQVGSKLLTCLLDQISSLKMANERLNKDLLETKAELETFRQQSLYHKGSSPIGTSPAHAHPPFSNGLIGGQYTPGFVTDLVRELRDNARMREEAMFSRLRTMMHERNDASLASSEAKFTEKSLEEIKSSLRASEEDKRRMMDRIAKLEDELRVIRVTKSEDSVKITNGNVEESETEQLRLRKELADMRKAKQNAEDHALKLERLVTQLRSKFNGLQITNGPDSLPSEHEHEASTRARRTSANSSSSTVVFGPVTDL